MAAKKSKVTKKVKSTVKHPKHKAASSKSDFWKVEFNINTVYWLIIGLAVVAIAVWTYNTNQQITDIYDSIDMNNIESDVVPVPNKPSVPAN